MQKQHEEDNNELTKRLSIKDEEIAKLKEQLQHVRLCNAVEIE